jgi:hypothetical protein
LVPQRGVHFPTFLKSQTGWRWDRWPPCFSVKVIVLLEWGMGKGQVKPYLQTWPVSWVTHIDWCGP